MRTPRDLRTIHRIGAASTTPRSRGNSGLIWPRRPADTTGCAAFDGGICCLTVFAGNPPPPTFDAERSAGATSRRLSRLQPPPSPCSSRTPCSLARPMLRRGRKWRRASPATSPRTLFVISAYRPSLTLQHAWKGNSVVSAAFRQNRRGSREPFHRPLGAAGQSAIGQARGSARHRAGICRARGPGAWLAVTCCVTRLDPSPEAFLSA